MKQNASEFTLTGKKSLIYKVEFVYDHLPYHSKNKLTTTKHPFSHAKICFRKQRSQFSIHQKCLMFNIPADCKI